MTTARACRLLVFLADAYFAGIVECVARLIVDTRGKWEAAGFE